MLDAALAEELKRYEPDLNAIRHDIHRHPEVGFEEAPTARLVAERLREWGVEVTEGIATTGVVGALRGDRPGQRAIGLRADLDALHIHETSGRDYASEVPGFVLIGNGVARDGSFHNVHTPLYDFNDEIISLDAGYWVSLVQKELA
jgi:metal-dependent amidase/aminoacylase/carboxypeptidase family protein